MLRYFYENKGPYCRNLIYLYNLISPSHPKRLFRRWYKNIGLGYLLYSSLKRLVSYWYLVMYFHYWALFIIFAYFVFFDVIQPWFFGVSYKGKFSPVTFLDSEIYVPKNINVTNSLTNLSFMLNFKGNKEKNFSKKEAIDFIEDRLIHGHAAQHCSSYLAPMEPAEWNVGCDPNCVTSSLNFFKWNFGVQRIVDLSRGKGDNFDAYPSLLGAVLDPVLEDDLLLPGENVREVPLAILALRALKYLKGTPSLFLLAYTELRSEEISSTIDGNWINEFSFFPSEIKTLLLSATHQGRDASHLISLLNNPILVLTTLLTARLSESHYSLLTAGSESGFKSANVIVFSPAASLLSDSSFRLSELDRLKRLVCGLSLDWSVELISGHIRIFPPLRVYAMPPRTIPPALWGEITDYGAVPVRHLYHNEALEPGGTPRIVHYSNGTISILLWKASRREESYYGITDTYLFNILDRNKALVKNKRVVILGSLEPWYECVALTWGAGEIFTIEYGGRTSDHPAFQFITPSLMEKMVREGTFVPFDAAFSISSFEHDGLGRYGDPLSGDGDIRTMAFVRDYVVKPGGHLFFTVPMGRDCIKWNEERVYGKNRLPKLIEGWEVADSEGIVLNKFEEGSEVCHEEHWQPIYLLRSPAEKYQRR